MNNNNKNIYDHDIEISGIENKDLGSISDKDKLIAGKQILLGIAILFIYSVTIYAFRPEQGSVLLEICKTSFPPLATLIIAFYFKEKTK